MIACLATAACLLAPTPAAVGPARPPVSLVAAPARVSLVGRAHERIRVTNSGTSRTVVDVGRAGFALDLRGRPRVVPRPGSRSWLTVRPARLVLPPGGSATLEVASSPPRRAEPGDHAELVLLTTRPRPGAGLGVRMRIGIVVAVRVPGRIVHRLEVLRIRARPAGRARTLELLLANRGSVTEAPARGCLVVTLRRGGRQLAVLRAGAFELLPRTGGIVEVVYRGRARGWVTARVDHAVRASCARLPARSFRLRL